MTSHKNWLVAVTAVVGVLPMVAQAHFVLVVNSVSELPADPTAETTDAGRGVRSVSVPIQSPAAAPVLADGIFVHTAKSADPFETEIQLPNISCPKCILQVVEFMAQHGV